MKEKSKSEVSIIGGADGPTKGYEILSTDIDVR